MKTLGKIVERTIYLTVFFICANIDTLAGAVDIATGGKTDLQSKWIEFLHSKMGNKEES